MAAPFKLRIIVTMGDPCGVGPEIIVKLFAMGESGAQPPPLVIGEPLALERAARLLGCARRIQRVSNPRDWADSDLLDTIPVYTPQPLTAGDLAYGSPSLAACHATVCYIESAVSMAMEGTADAICTCPIHKGNLHRQGFDFPGHTEFLCRLTSADKAVMMLAGPRLRVSLVTIHEALEKVSRLITAENLTDTIRITGESLVRDFGLRAPRIAVAALNPHAGEGGRFGREEMDIIEPTLVRLGAAEWSVHGPFPADTLFFRAFQGEFDAVVAMYHDQGLVPIKLVHFHDAVNVTLGLPIVRTSVDHGTAYELAGTGRAHPGSLQAAVRMATQMARHRLG
jgi:4-hydroxythreonine-4-phosphate dehydrogenase